MVALDVAMDLKLPVTCFVDNIFRKPDQGVDVWLPIDFLLATAYKTLQRETCVECGVPLWVCRSRDPYLNFSVRVNDCRGKLAFAKWSESASGKNAGKGAVPYLVANMGASGSGVPLPTRLAYFAQLEKEG